MPTGACVEHACTTHDHTARTTGLVSNHITIARLLVRSCGKARRANRMITHTLLAAAMLCALSMHAVAQETGTLSGKVVDAATGDAIIAATILIEGTNLGARTTTSGTFTISKVPAVSVTIKVSSIGFASQSVSDVIVASRRKVSLD